MKEVPKCFAFTCKSVAYLHTAYSWDVDQLWFHLMLNSPLPIPCSDVKSFGFNSIIGHLLINPVKCADDPRLMNLDHGCQLT